jgi:Staphylococcal nuclease homologue
LIGKLRRHYAFVLVDGKDLAESLVEHGLARVFGEKAIPPDGRTTKSVIEKLQGLEREAKRQRFGAWARSNAPPEAPTRALPAMPLPKPLPAVTPPATNTTAQTEELYRISRSGVRHNSKCRYFDSPNNKPCGPNEGRACQICGG